MVREQIGREAGRSREIVDGAIGVATRLRTSPDEVFTAGVELLVVAFTGFLVCASGQGVPAADVREFEKDLSATLVECCARHGAQARIIRWDTEEG